MQAKLPDVNAAIVRHRSLALEGFKTGNPELAFISIGSINALLPTMEDGTTYKVKIDSEEYYKLKAETREICCGFCKQENQLKHVEQYDLELDWIEKILSSVQVQRMWVCNLCKKSNVFSTDDITVTKVGEPYYFKVMPSPPKMQQGLRGRMTFNAEFERWFDIAIGEIESQIGRYRSEYAKQEESERTEITEET